MATPKNCTECAHVRSCHAPYYGSSLCAHGKEINRAAIDAQLNNTKGGEKHG